MFQYDFTNYRNSFRMSSGSNSIPMAQAHIIDSNVNTNTSTASKNNSNAVIATETTNILKVLCIDNSGSMSEDASNNEEAKGYTRRDFACQGGMLIIKSLPVGTKVCVISFDDNAKVICEPTLLTNDNKQHICYLINQIKADGGTNIRSSLLLAKKKMEQENAERADIILITDGEDDQLKNGVNLDTKFKDLKSHGEYKLKIDTIGLGPNADTKLLVKIAELCGGVYALCYSAFEVGTVFGRAAARMQLDHDDVYCICEREPQANHANNEFHEIAKASFISYKDLLTTILTDEDLSMTMMDANQEKKIQDYIQNVSNWLDTNKANNKVTPSFYYDYIKDLLVDVKEQIYLAISNPTYWKTWGYSYWQTTGMALKKCYSPNSKDISLSHFGSQKANELYEEISDLYESMPLIQKTGYMYYNNNYNNYNNYNNNNVVHAQPLTTSYFNDRDAGCFHPHSTFTLHNGEIVDYDYIFNCMKLGQEVWLLGQNGAQVKVETLIQTPIPNDFPGVKFCKVGKTVLTPTHPIFHEDPETKNKCWVHPLQIAPIYREQVDFVFNLILAKDEKGQRYSSVMVDDQLCVCLGHGIMDGSVAEDSFWGSENVVNEYKRIYSNDYEKGYICTVKHEFLCSNETNYVVGFKEIEFVLEQ